MNTARPTSAEVAQWIVGYLTRYPRAADTARHIQRWWLAPLHADVPLDVVREALAELERQQIVSKLDGPTSEPVYGRGPGF